MSVHAKMSRQNRAKQFMPFAALKGYEEELRKKEKITVPRMEISEDCFEELDRTIKQVQPGNIVSAVYYEDGQYVRRTGMVAHLDFDKRILQIVDTRIPLDDIVELNVPA